MKELAGSSRSGVASAAAWPAALTRASRRGKFPATPPESLVQGTECPGTGNGIAGDRGRSARVALVGT